MNEKFKKILAVVLSFVGIDELPKKDGKSVLSDDLKKSLSEQFGEKFVEKFGAELAEYEASGASTADADHIAALKKQYTELKAMFDKSAEDWKDKEKELNAKIEKLGKESEQDDPEKIDMKGNSGKRAVFKPNMAYMHNKVIDNYFNGDGSMQYSGNDTIDTAELQAEFGKYISGQKIDFFKELNHDLTVTNYMTTIVTDKTEWRAAKSVITSVLQQFTNKWSPSGKTKFTPITIRNYFLKVNLPITPSDIIDQFIGHMYDENLTSDQMPIVKYITDVLLRPKLAEDLELALVNAKFVERPVENDNDPGSSPDESMDGCLTTLKKLKATVGNKVVWLLDGVELTRENIVDQMEKAVDSVSPLYKKKKMLIHADPDLIVMYRRAYRDKYPTTKNEDEDKLRVDFSNFTFAPVEGMIGTMAFFITPKENFIHLMSRNPNEAKIFIQVQNYDVKVFMEFRKGTGFAMQEAIFAYLPPVEAGEDGALEDEEDETGGDGI